MIGHHEPEKNSHMPLAYACVAKLGYFCLRSEAFALRKKSVNRSFSDFPALVLSNIYRSWLAIFHSIQRILRVQRFALVAQLQYQNIYFYCVHQLGVVRTAGRSDHFYVHFQRLLVAIFSKLPHSFVSNRLTLLRPCGFFAFSDCPGEAV